MPNTQPAPRGLSYLVMVVSADTRVQEALPPALVAVDPSAEVQGVDSIPALEEHVRGVAPDALVLDAQHMAAPILHAVLTRRLAGDGPVVVLAPSDPMATLTQQDMLQHGASAWVGRGPGDLLAVRDAVVNNGRIARLRGTLVEQERHFGDILDALHDGVFVLDRGIFTYANRSFAALVGQTPQALVKAHRLADFLAPERQADVVSQLASLQLGDAEPRPMTIDLVLPHGPARIYEMQCRASWLQGRRCVVGVGRDVTQTRKTAAELEATRQRAAHVERLRALGELAAGVAHDFNNALGTILGRVCLARDKLERQENVSDDLRVIELASRHAASTVQRIQEFSRPSNTDSWRDVDVGEVCHEAAAFIRTRVPGHVALTVELSAAPRVRGNASELREVLLNLLRNALDALGETPGTVTLRALGRDTKAVVEVQDSGPGMSAETQKRLFEPFFSTKAKAGTGLGLSVSHWILRRHDADIHVESSPAGTLFRLSFEPFGATLSPPAAVRRTIRAIMVVDDDAAVADMLRDLLEEQGFSVTVVGSATAALQILNKQPCDLVITDLDLPDLGGWQLARRMRQQRPDLLVGLMTGWPLGAASDELHARGISFVLNKPFSMEALTRNLTRLGH